MRKPIIHSFVILSFFLLFSSTVRSQDYIIMDEGFEKEDNSSWSFSNGLVREGVSYMGNNSLEIHGRGEGHCFVNVPENVEEIIVKGWIKVVGSNSVTEEEREESGPINLDDTLHLPETVMAPKVSLNIEAFSGNDLKNQVSVSEANIGFVEKHTNGWVSFEREIKIPVGTKRIKVVCQNTINSTTAYFDGILVEKRQVGLVKSESAWAKSVREFNEKAKRLVKNGDFEDGAQIWDPYWGFELSSLAHSGKYSCMIQNSDTGAWKGTSNLIPYKIPAGTKKLKVSVWIKAENVIGGPNAWETGAILLALKDDHGNDVAGGEAVARTVGTHDWKKYETYFNISSRATRFNILLQLGASTGKIYFDDILAEPMGEEDYYLANLKIKNPGFENGLFGWSGTAGNITEEQAHSGKYSLKVGSNKPVWEQRFQSVSLQRGKSEVKLSGWMKAVNLSQNNNQAEGGRFYVEFKDEIGVSFSESILIGRAGEDFDWKQFTKTISIPPGALEMIIYCGRANVTGAVYFDDISVEYPN